ncbi:MAG: DUF1684 domain-containing protein [Flavobacteriaceae bacterium]|nr:DUF1684 domain-containing protein [Flavobacteriaceae bacterium]
MSNSLKSLFLFCLLVFLVLSCTEHKVKVQYASAFQKKMNELFKDASKSPLKPKDLKTFSSLSFFPIDSSFVVKAKLTPTPNSEYFDMKTTTERVSKERIFGVLSFSLLGQSVELNVYQAMDTKEEQPNYLFLPFLDDTNGLSTYGGGRYMDLTVPKSDSIWLDFNTAYNPYCVYNELYSCPIVPRQNYIPLGVNAGVKNFK